MAQDVVNQALVGFGQHVLMEFGEFFGSQLGIEDDDGSVRLRRGKPVIAFKQERLRPAGEKYRKYGDKKVETPSII